MYITLAWWYVLTATLLGRLLYRCGKATRYSVRIGERTMSLLMSLNSFQSSSPRSASRKSGSNFGPPGMHMLSALAVWKLFMSNR